MATATQKKQVAKLADPAVNAAGDHLEAVGALAHASSEAGFPIWDTVAQLLSAGVPWAKIMAILIPVFIKMVTGQTIDWQQVIMDLLALLPTPPVPPPVPPKP